ncbi:hypothetical protein [Bradyrhizobium neotropicale]|uniref:hypothetical protein n=1 Tax=Bradyrhizobium neotropicale TaxID=1497615 RepID=UPI001AD77E6D|nr:hypothetical protein [Bradyrhizobium neotropicale]MBO4221929.1 hypothetical protein [Bradyrhizobium neotropicale]
MTKPPKRERLHAPVLDLPKEVAVAFMEDVRAYYEESSQTKRDVIAVRQLHTLNEHLPPRAKRLRLSDVKELFKQMRQAK